MRVIFACILALCVQGSCATTDGIAGDGDLAVRLERLRREHNVPAIAAVCVSSNGVVEMAAVGFRAQGRPERVTTNDLWHIGSITKGLTATLAARLVERGTIEWADPAGKLLSHIADMRQELRDVTLEEVLCHRAGLMRNPTSDHARSIRQEPNLKQQRARFAALLMSAAPEFPRGEYHYSNSGYILAGWMLEQAAGSSWEDLLQRELCAPLGLRHVGYGPPGHGTIPDQPWGHEETADGFKVYAPSAPGADNPPIYRACGALHLSLLDMAAFARAYLAGGNQKTNYLSSNAWGRLQTPGKYPGQALAWGYATKPWCGPMLSHTGSNNRWYATLQMAPKAGYAGFVVINAAGQRAEQACEAGGALLTTRFRAAAGY